MWEINVRAQWGGCLGGLWKLAEGSLGLSGGSLGTLWDLLGDSLGTPGGLPGTPWGFPDFFIPAEYPNSEPGSPNTVRVTKSGLRLTDPEFSGGLLSPPLGALGK